MKRFIFILAVMFLALSVAVVAADKKEKGETIQSGEIFYSVTHFLAGDPLTMGFDGYGYNYQGHMFKGSYFNSYAGGDGLPLYMGDDDAYLAENPGAASHWAWPYRQVYLEMKWNDAWISNKDYDDDGALDRHPGYLTYTNSGAWLTNHQKGGEKKTSWVYFVKIITAFDDWDTVGNIWSDEDGNEIGTVIWGSFAIVLTVSNDPALGEHGVVYRSPTASGFGRYGPRKP